MYRIYFVFNGSKIYDVNYYTLDEARHETRLANRDFVRNPSKYRPMFFEHA